MPFFVLASVLGFDTTFFGVAFATGLGASLLGAGIGLLTGVSLTIPFGCS